MGLKKSAAIALLGAVLALQTSCGIVNGTAKKAYEQAKMSMASMDYKSAVNYLKLAEDEGFKDEGVDELINVIQGYLDAKDAYDADNIDGANQAIAAIPDAYTNYVIASDIDELKSQIGAKQSAMGNVDGQIAGVRNMISYGDYTSAKANIEELKSKELTEYQKKQVEEMDNTINAANAKIDAEANKQPDVVYVETQVPVSSGNTNVVATYYVVNCNEWITLRSEPSASASSLAQIPLGRAVGFIENAGNGFYKINYDGKVGYALAQYLSSSRQSASSSSSGRTGQIVNCDEWITLRSSASTSASSLAQIHLGAYLTVISEAGNGFYYVKYSGQYGYALKQYIALR